MSVEVAIARFLIVTNSTVTQFGATSTYKPTVGDSDEHTTTNVTADASVSKESVKEDEVASSSGAALPDDTTKDVPIDASISSKGLQDVLNEAVVPKKEELLVVGGVGPGSDASGAAHEGSAATFML